MTRIQRNLILRTWLTGIALTLAVILAQRLGLLSPVERWLYDIRAQHCQSFTPEPTDQLVHLDIDDRALATIGPWPWPRSVLAQIVDQLADVQVRAMAMDIVFLEPQPVRYQKPQADAPPLAVHDDALLAASLSRFNRALLPMVFDVSLPGSLDRAISEELTSDVELTHEELLAKLKARGFDYAGLDRDLEDAAIPLRRQAISRRIDGCPPGPLPPIDDLRQQILPRTDPLLTGSPLLNMLREEYEQVRSLRILRPMSLPAQPAAPRVLQATRIMPPIPELAASARQTGFVYYLPDPDGVVRSLPLWIEHRGRLFPQMGLTLACMVLGADLQQARLEPDRLVIPRSGGDVVIPVRRRPSSTLGHPIDQIMDLPWFGPPQHWELMYDPARKRPAQHLPITEVWQSIELRQKMAANNASIDKAISVIFDNDAEYKLGLDPAKGQAYAAARPAADDVAGRETIAAAALKELDDSGWLKAFAQIKEQDLDANQRFQRDQLILARRVLDQAMAQNRQLREQLSKHHASLHARLSGRAVLVGWIATGAAADFVPTSLHAKCPGVVVHGTVFNAVMTGDFWRQADPWVSLAMTILVGLLVTFCATALSPVASLIGSILIAAAYLILNGVYFFDYGNLLVAAAPPLATAGLVWSGCTLAHFITERRERTRITRRFQSYVDPALVHYVIENPAQARLDGEMREMTVVFTDLAGFTTLSEKLREHTVPLLNRYMDLMVPVIRQHQGYVNKFLGDGIMFFYGAPQPNSDHAAAAVMTVLRMQQVMDQFNASLAAEGLPTVTMRAGVSSGPMVVGDAGSEQASDYTVLGDTVNLGARLESANKAMGTKVLLTHRTVELLGHAMFLVRPIAKLQVVGKTEGVLTYEPLAPWLEATESQKRLAELSRQMVEAFLAGRFGECLKVTDQLAGEYGPTKLTALYRELCQQYLRQPPDEFDGHIVLTEK